MRIYFGSRRPDSSGAGRSRHYDDDIAAVAAELHGGRPPQPPSRQQQPASRVTASQQRSRNTLSSQELSSKLAASQKRAEASSRAGASSQNPQQSSSRLFPGPMLPAIQAAFDRNPYLRQKGAAKALLESLAAENPAQAEAWKEISKDSVTSWFSRQRKEAAAVAAAAVGSEAAPAPAPAPDEPSVSAAAPDAPSVSEGAARMRQRTAADVREGLPAGPLAAFSPRTAKAARKVASSRRSNSFSASLNAIHSALLRLAERHPGTCWAFAVKAPHASGGHGRLRGDAGGPRWNSDAGCDDAMAALWESDRKLARKIQRGEMPPFAIPERERRHVNSSAEYAKSGSPAFLVYQAHVRLDTVASLIAREAEAGASAVSKAIRASWRALSSAEKAKFGDAMPDEDVDVQGGVCAALKTVVQDPQPMCVHCCSCWGFKIGV